MKRTLILAVAMLMANFAAADEMGDFLGQLEGGWYGENNRSPMGPMGFAMVWTRDDDGALHSRTVANRDTWIDLRFFEGDDGRWMMRQAAALSGLGEQSSILEPIASEGNLKSWADPERPDYLRVDLAVNESEMYMKVLLRGREHATFQMERTTAEEARDLLAGFERAAEMDQKENPLVASGSAVPQAIIDARGAIIADPEAAEPRVALARVLAEQIQSKPATAPTYAGEMLGVLKEALELDPSYPETYEMLIGYYIHAPAIAGGSKEKAAELAAKLAELAPERAASMQQMIAARN